MHSTKVSRRAALTLFGAFAALAVVDGAHAEQAAQAAQDAIIGI